ncbi:Delta glutathione S-transferase [Gryllus bimaculatus]|nr:Delta glutathione S-transferase [Gryllus bimaculatus]
MYLEFGRNNLGYKMTSLRLYSLSDSPPACAVRLCLECLGLNYTTVDVDYVNGEHLSEEYALKNPQKEIPVLDDNGFLLSESAAILQYLSEKYDTQGKLYPKDVQQRAIVNHRLAFNLSSYYQRILEYAIAPIFFDYPKTTTGLKKMKESLSVFNTILQRQGAKFSAGDSLTIADFALVAATMCLEAVEFDLSNYPNIVQWYNNFKREYPKLWAISEKAMLELHEFYKNPPNLSEMKHPYHPVRKQ